MKFKIIEKANGKFFAKRRVCPFFWQHLSYEYREIEVDKMPHTIRCPAYLTSEEEAKQVIIGYIRKLYREESERLQEKQERKLRRTTVRTKIIEA